MSETPGGDVAADPKDLDAHPAPLTTDPDQQSDDAELDGTEGEGGAG